MSADDQQRWDARYTEADVPIDGSMPDGFVGFDDVLPTSGRALDVACGAGRGSVWLAERGLEVVGIDVSPVAVAAARQLAADAGCADRCRFEVHDLDLGLPDGEPVDLVTCHLFSAPGLDQAMLERLVPGGVLAMTVLSEVGAEAGPFRVPAGGLLARFEGAEVLAHREGDGTATLIARSVGPQSHGRLD